MQTRSGLIGFSRLGDYLENNVVKEKVKRSFTPIEPLYFLFILAGLYRFPIDHYIHRSVDDTTLHCNNNNNNNNTYTIPLHRDAYDGHCGT
jgi:hypothetical protein